MFDYTCILPVKVRRAMSATLHFSLRMAWGGVVYRHAAAVNEKEWRVEQSRLDFITTTDRRA